MVTRHSAKYLQGILNALNASSHGPRSISYEVEMELLVLPLPPDSAVPETATRSNKTAGHKQEDLPPDATRLSGEAEGLKHRSLCPAMTRSCLPAQAEELKTQKVTSTCQPTQVCLPLPLHLLKSSK